MVSCCSPEKKRRTKYIARSLDPEWHQTLVFMNIPRTQLVAKTLEVTVWDYDRFKPNDFLGEVLIELSGTSSPEITSLNSDATLLTYQIRFPLVNLSCTPSSILVDLLDSGISKISQRGRPNEGAILVTH